MSEDGAAHCQADAETQTYSSACSAHTGGPMQLQSDTEEKKVSAYSLRASLLKKPPKLGTECLHSGRTLKSVFIWCTQTLM